MREDGVEPLAVGTAPFEDDGAEVALEGEFGEVADGGGRDHHQFLVEDRFLVEVRVVDGAGDEGAIEAVLAHLFDEAGRGAGDDGQVDSGVGLDIGREDRRQAEGGAGFERADPQAAVRGAVVMRGCMRLAEQGCEFGGVGHEAFAGGGQHGAAAAAFEQAGADGFFEHLDAGGDVGLHHVQFGGGPVHAPMPGDGFQDPEIGVFHGRF